MKMTSLAEELGSTTYPGRGIVIGKSKNGKYAVTAYLSWEEARTAVTVYLLRMEKESVPRHLTLQIK